MYKVGKIIISLYIGTYMDVERIIIFLWIHSKTLLLNIYLFAPILQPLQPIGWYSDKNDWIILGSS